jgi:hypothetical protein
LETVGSEFPKIRSIRALTVRYAVYGSFGANALTLTLTLTYPNLAFTILDRNSLEISTSQL